LVQYLTRGTIRFQDFFFGNFLSRSVVGHCDLILKTNCSGMEERVSEFAITITEFIENIQSGQFSLPPHPDQNLSLLTSNIFEVEDQLRKLKSILFTKYEFIDTSSLCVFSSDLVGHIFSFLDFRTASIVRRVSRQWKIILDKKWSSIFRNLDICVRSAGFIPNPNICEIFFFGFQIPMKYKMNNEGYCRGLNVVLLRKGRIFFCGAFDTYESEAESNHLELLLKRLQDGDIIAIGVKDEGTQNLSNLRKQFSSMGSKLLNKLEFRGSWIFIYRHPNIVLQELSNNSGKLIEAKVLQKL